MSRQDQGRAEVKDDPKEVSREASPNQFSGHNFNTPLFLYDTHPNQRFAVGEEVIPTDPADVPMTGQVIGHCAEDRVWVRWAHGMVTQEDVVDVIAKREYALDSSRMDQVNYDSSKSLDRNRQASRTAEHFIVGPKTHPSTIKELEKGAKPEDEKKQENTTTRSSAYVGLLGAASIARNAGYKNEADSIEAACLVAKSLEELYGSRPRRIASCPQASAALVSMTKDINSAIRSLVSSGKPELIAAGVEAAHFYRNALAYSEFRG